MDNARNVSSPFIFYFATSSASLSPPQTTIDPLLITSSPLSFYPATFFFSSASNAYTMCCSSSSRGFVRDEREMWKWDNEKQCRKRLGSLISLMFANKDDATLMLSNRCIINGEHLLNCWAVVYCDLKN